MRYTFDCNSELPVEQARNYLHELEWLHLVKESSLPTPTHAKYRLWNTTEKGLHDRTIKIISWHWIGPNGRIVEETGNEPSLTEDETKQYLEQVIREVKKQKADTNKNHNG